jgi:hypothetical protein
VRAQTCQKRCHCFEDLFKGSAKGALENSKHQC